MRKLASIQKIKSLEPIEGADAIEKATVLGWQVIVRKGDFRVGDAVVYCEIDCLMPDRPEFEFLKPRGMRIRTIKLKGQISQGICFPIEILPIEFFQEEQDVTEVLGITKYEPPVPACLSGIVKGKFPSFIPKTDETRVQILQKLLDKYKDEECYITEKLDGSSVTYFVNEGIFGVCSRNMELLEDPTNSFWKVARAMDVEAKLRNIGGNYAIQGELIGEGVQGNKYKIKGHTVRFFSLFDIDIFEYVSFKLFGEILDNINLPTVPILTSSYLLENDIPKLVEKSNLKSQLNPNVWVEGIVIRPLKEQIDLLLSNEKFNNGRVSFKVINPEFLIKYE